MDDRGFNGSDRRRAWTEFSSRAGRKDQLIIGGGGWAAAASAEAASARTSPHGGGELPAQTIDQPTPSTDRPHGHRRALRPPQMRRAHLVDGSSSEITDLLDHTPIPTGRLPRGPDPAERGRFMIRSRCESPEVAQIRSGRMSASDMLRQPGQRPIAAAAVGGEVLFTWVFGPARR